MEHTMKRKLLAFISILGLFILLFPVLRGDPGHGNGQEIDQTFDTISATNTAVSKLLTASAVARIGTSEPR